ncbi:MAG: hypothetical protein AAF433_12630 [Bacteroidota bacterium]
MKKWFGYLILTAVLAGFPMVSYFYLKGGYNYRKAAIEMMEDHGKMPSLQGMERVRGQLPDSLRGNMVVVGWLSPSTPQAATVYGRVLDSLYDQFADSPHLYFTTIVDSSMTEASIDKWLADFGLPQEDPMLSIIRPTTTSYDGRKTAFDIPANDQNPMVALVDSSMTIIKHYDLVEREETIDLVQLVSLFIPLPEEEDIILARDKEL